MERHEREMLRCLHLGRRQGFERAWAIVFIACLIGAPLTALLATSMTQVAVALAILVNVSLLVGTVAARQAPLDLDPPNSD